MQDWYNICKTTYMIHYINKMKDKNHMIISIDVEKAFNKIQHPFMIKILSKVEIHGSYLNIIKTIYKKPTPNIIVNKQKLKNASLKIRNKTGMSAFTALLQHSTGSRSHNDQTRRRNKRHPNWKAGKKMVIIHR